MLKLNAQLKKELFEFTDLDGSVHNLEVTQYTVGDTKKLIEMQSTITDDMSVIDQSDIIVHSRIACAVKVTETGQHFWKELEDISSNDYPNGFIDQLYAVVGDLNPVNVEALSEKKSKS